MNIGCLLVLNIDCLLVLNVGNMTAECRLFIGAEGCQYDCCILTVY